MLIVSFIFGVIVQKYWVEKEDKPEWLFNAQAECHAMWTTTSKLTNHFSQYEELLINYIKNPSRENREKWLAISSKFDLDLEKARDIFGLNVKRWCDLFLAWEHKLKHELSVSPNSIKNSSWHSELLHYFVKIKDQINISENDFKNHVADISIDGYFEPQKSDLKIKGTINKLYLNQIKFLIPDEAEALHKRKEMIACMGPRGNISSPKEMASWIAFLQYQTRYCPFLTSSKTNELGLCKTARATANQEGKDFQNKILVLCDITEDRLKEEQDDSINKYGALNYDEYFDKYVNPFIPRYLSELKNKINNKGDRFKVCDPTSLPVVNFRNPNIDAQLAAYAYVGPTLCQDYFFR